MGGPDTLRLPPHDLESCLAELARHGEAVSYVGGGLSPDLEIAAHYFQHSASSPASSRSGDEGIFVYDGRMPVLMGLFGSRRRNNLLLGGSAELDKRELVQRSRRPIAPALVERPACQQRVGHLSKLGDLPILRYTAADAGRYLTSGIVYAKSPVAQAFNASIHRMCVVDDERCTIWMVPGRHLETFHREALRRGESLPVSINIGGDPFGYLSCSLSPPSMDLLANEMAIAGGIKGRAFELARCAAVDALCFASADIVLEAEISAETLDEGPGPYSMPEFLGYMGTAKPRLPVVRVKAITTRERPFYQMFVGPGREQSELLALAQELSIMRTVGEVPGVELLDVHCPSYAGGLLVAIASIAKTSIAGDESAALLGERILRSHKYVKTVYVADSDIDIYSPEDVLFALTTRVQADLDTRLFAGAPGFPMDPSQTVTYRDERTGSPSGPVPLTCCVVDCTAPYRLKHLFQRASFEPGGQNE